MNPLGCGAIEATETNARKRPKEASLAKRSTMSRAA